MNRSSRTSSVARCVTRWSSRIGAVCTAVVVGSIHAYAQVFQGGGLQGGVDHAQGIQGISHNSDIRATVLNILKAVLNFLSVIAVGAVIIAGIYLIVSLGEDEAKEKARKTIIYTLAGLAVILFARVIVGLVTVYLAGKVA